MDRVRIISDGTYHGTRVMDSSGREIPGLSAVSITIKDGEPVHALLEATLVDLDIQADAVVPRVVSNPMARWPFPKGINEDATEGQKEPESGK